MQKNDKQYLKNSLYIVNKHLAWAKSKSVVATLKLAKFQLECKLALG
jgi:hypothetical protein